MIRRPPRSTQSRSSAASDVYKRQSVLQSLAGAHRYRGNQALGDVDQAVRLGLEGLRERAGDVLLQVSDENAPAVAREATNDASEMARWFLARGREDAAVSAIELGRGPGTS